MLLDVNQEIHLCEKGMPVGFVSNEERRGVVATLRSKRWGLEMKALETRLLAWARLERKKWL